MGTKNNPGRWDCYANANPDEPMFVLLGRDPTARFVVELWAKLRVELGDAPDSAQIREALQSAKDLEQWAASLGKGKQLAAAQLVVEQMLKMEWQ